MENIQYCGPQALGLKPPRVVFFEASCKKHDDGYTEGGNELRRLICDLFFLTHMLNDINKLVPTWYMKTFYILWALLYFILCRLFGWVIFNHK